jgi:hypothetical protein
MFSGSAVLLVEVVNLSDAIVNALKNLPFVSNVSRSGNTLNVELDTTEDVRAQVSQEITRLGGTIVSMSFKGRKLEDVFIQLIEKHQGSNAP